MPVTPAHAELSPLTKRLFGSLESGDVDAYISTMDVNCRGAIGNMEPVTNREAIRTASEQLYTVIKKVTHDILNEWVVGSDTIVEATATYERRDGKAVSLPSATIYTVNDLGLISFYRIYIDQTPLFAA